MASYKKIWNTCDVCGRFISYGDLVGGKAKHVLVYPSSHFTEETYETLCKKHLDTTPPTL